MGLRSALASSLTRAARALGPGEQVEKAFGGSEPPAIAEAARDVSQMTMDHPFAPGEPILPYDGYSRTPRTHDFTTGYNIATRPRSHERVSFDTLRGLVDSYDVAQICIWHRIDSIRSLDWQLVAADGYSGDVTDAIAIGMKALEKPDRVHDFGTWFAKWAFDTLAFDAGCLYRMRNRAGKVIGLKPVDGTLIAPLLDYWGESPEPPAEAFVQYVNGLPWNWLTRDDLIYEPFRPRTNSPYGHAPLESIILNANTDIRFQVYFLERFTSGNIPEAFASAPEAWSPDQIETFQGYWDSFMYGDQAAKHQIKWIPGGSSFTWSNEKDFSDTFSLHMMRKSCAAYHVVPTDIGFTENSNYSTGESQADVGHRVGDLPFGRHIERIITGFLRRDLGLPLKHQFDWGEEQDDRVAQAQADQLMIDRAVISASEIRQMRYGLTEPAGQTVPRVFFTSRAGPIPLSSLYAVAGPVDTQTSAPDPDAPLPHTAFTNVEGVVPSPPLREFPLAEREYGPKAIPAGPPPQPVTQDPPPPLAQPEAVAKEALPAGTSGITSETGIVGYDGPGRHDDDSEDQKRAATAVAEDVAKAELAAFRRFERGRRKAGAWRDFEFAAVDAATAARLNAGGRAAVAKGDVPGLTACSGMISLDIPDGLIDPLPGGVTDFHVTVVYLGPDVDDEAFAAACQRARDAAAAMPGPLTATITGVGSFPPSASSDGKTPAWAAALLPDCAEELRASLADLSASEHADWHPHVTLAYLDEGDPMPPPLPPVPVTFGYLSVHRGDDVARFPLGPPEIAKAGGAGPKAPAGTQPPPANQQPPVQQAWPGWRLIDTAVTYWGPVIAATLAAILTAELLEQLATAYLAAFPGQQGDAPGKRDRNAEAAAWLATWLTAHGVTLDLAEIAAGILTDGYIIGAASAEAAAAGTRADLGGWQPGDSTAARDRVGELGGAAALAALLAAQNAETAAQVAAAAQNAAARTLAGTNGNTSARALAAALVAALAVGALATGLALAVLCDTVATAAHDFFCGFGKSPPGLGLGDFQWVTDPELQNCAICLANAAAPARPYGDSWPSGDTTPGIHIKCGCALVPA